jgi:hypothetical protein
LIFRSITVGLVVWLVLQAVPPVHASQVANQMNYQAVLSQRFEADVTAEPLTVYRALRHVNPSPYMYFIRMGGVAVVGSSLVASSGSGSGVHCSVAPPSAGRSGDQLSSGSEEQFNAPFCSRFGNSIGEDDGVIPFGSRAEKPVVGNTSRRVAARTFEGC